jgi:hypothetical protein
MIMRRFALIVTLIILTTPLAMPGELPSKEVHDFIKSTYKYGDYTKATHDREKAVLLLQDYLKKNRDKLSDYDKVHLLATLAGLYCGNAKPRTRDDVKARKFFRQGALAANGKLNDEALGCIGAALTIHPNNRRQRLAAMIQHVLFLNYLKGLTDDELTSMLLKPNGAPYGTPNGVAKYPKTQLIRIRNECNLDVYLSNINDMSKKWHSREVKTVKDAYLLLLLLGEKGGAANKLTDQQADHQ